MMKLAVVTRSSIILSTVLSAGMAVSQGVPPDPRAGQSSTAPQGAPTNTPQAQQSASPSANTTSTPQEGAANQPTQAAPPSPQPSLPPSQQKSKDKNTSDTSKNQPAPSAASVQLTPSVTGSPETKIFDASATGKHTGVTGALDPLLDTPPLPKGKPTLIGGTATKVDRVRNRVTVEPFGAKAKTPIYIDERSHIYRNGVETTILSIKKGDRVYFDTMLDGPHIFAKNVRVVSETGAAEVRGQITAYDAQRGTIELQDALSSRPVSFRITGQTHVKTQQGSASIGDLAKGALVDVTFAPDKANRGIATEVLLLARPGTSYTFAGVITNLNLRDGVISVENQTDGKVYDIDFDPRSKSERSALRVGNAVNVSATFDGANYKATNVTVTEAVAKPKGNSDQPKPKADDDQE